MYQSNGRQKFIVRGVKFYKAVLVGLGRRRYSLATFKRAADAETYGASMAERINRFLTERSSQVAQE